MGMHCLEIYAWGSKEAVGVVLWAVRVVGVVRAVKARGGHALAALKYSYLENASNG